MPTRDTNIDALTEAELLVQPESLIPAGSLTTYWALHAAAVQKDNADELARERSGASRSRRMIGGAETEQEAEARRQQEHQRDLRRREDALLAMLAAQEREARTVIRAPEAPARLPRTQCRGCSFADYCWGDR